MSRFEKYFSKKFEELKDSKRDINSLLNDKMMLISGDFYGIQKFIFERLATKNASKVLRAKSAFIQLYTIYLTKYICHRLEIDEKFILTQNAGKFEILSPNLDENILNDIQSKVDRYFIDKFYGLSGVSISSISCVKDDFLSEDSYRKLRNKISEVVELKKFYKFDLLQNQNYVLDLDENIDNQTLCKICNIRKKELNKEECIMCRNFVELGKKLATKTDEIIKSSDLYIDFDDFICVLELDEKIKSYVAKNDKNEIVDFEKLAEIAEGTNAIGVLKADVDGMGNFIKNSDITESFENFDLFSKTLDNFFSLHIPKMMKQKYPNTYTVFAGGDDLFLVGSWDEILKLARFVESEFKSFVVSKELTISSGIAIAKPSTPISYLAEYTEHLLEEAKALEGKNAISLFGETVKWNSYKQVFNELDDALKAFENKDINTAFLYRLLEFCQMSKESKRDPLKTIWKSKLRYSISRNNVNLGENIYELLDKKIEKNPSETKMFLNEFIYKRRK